MKSGNVFEVADVIRTLQVQENEKNYLPASVDYWVQPDRF